MCYVPVDVHGGGDAVFRDVFVAVWTRFTVDRVDTGDGNSLLPQSYVAVNRQSRCWSGSVFCFQSQKCRDSGKIKIKSQGQSCSVLPLDKPLTHRCVLQSDLPGEHFFSPISTVMCKPHSPFQFFFNRPSTVSFQPVKEFFLCSEPVVLGVLSLPPVGLQGRPGLGVVAAAVWRSFSLAVLQKHICSSSQEKPEDTTFYWSSTTTHFWTTF